MSILTPENVHTLPQRASRTAKTLGKITLVGAEFEVVEYSQNGGSTDCSMCDLQGFECGYYGLNAYGKVRDAGLNHLDNCGSDTWRLRRVIQISPQLELF